MEKQELRKMEMKKEIITDKEEQKDFTTLLDLDNTLIYTTSLPYKYDFKINIFNKKIKKKVNLFVKKRSYLNDFLEGLSKFSTIYVYTTADPSYAKQVVTNIDPKGIYIKKIYDRTSCTVNANHIKKDITLCGVKMARSVIVDDAPACSFEYPENALYIHPFKGESQDAELPIYLKKLEDLSKFDDVRDGIRKICNDF